ncbi:uncharacterized protein HaLaN_05825 [Haematococcus lacustris]|uniref:Uncharacterized protein n=1 Tax=Haematococcus lacustris TaxID=44745 RepID=A0A699YLW4_HAELA|nr:uncharacterized protein HaLaN_05825 [Haematococcus lacustris]
MAEGGKWGVANLSFRRSPVVNAYEGLLVEAYLRASGRKVDSHIMTYSDTGVDHDAQQATGQLP